MAQSNLQGQLTQSLGEVGRMAQLGIINDKAEVANDKAEVANDKVNNQINGGYSNTLKSSPDIPMPKSPLEFLGLRLSEEAGKEAQLKAINQLKTHMHNINYRFDRLNTFATAYKQSGNKADLRYSNNAFNGIKSELAGVKKIMNEEIK